MSHSDSEDQFLAMREFFTKTWKIFIAVIVIGLLAFWGWRYWQSYQVEKITVASDQYEQLLSKLAADNSATTEIDELIAFAKNTDTIYSVFASLKAAQIYVQDLKDYAGAETLLTDASKKTDSEPVLAIINIRLARLQYQLGKYDESLKTLDKVTNENWSVIVNDIRGDIFVKTEHYQQACNAYNVALSSKPTADLEKSIKLKLNRAEYLLAEQDALAKQQAAQEAKSNQAVTSEQKPQP